jgi:GTPase Era involved in 16S rRNA processing
MLNVFKAINEEFDEKIAISVVQVITINSTLKLRDSEWSVAGQRVKRITKRARKVLFELNDDEFHLVMSLLDVSHDWKNKQSLQGLGGCEVKTFKELLGK